MTVRIRRWHGMVMVGLILAGLMGVLFATVQGSREAQAQGPPLATLAPATRTPVPTQGWWLAATVQWEDWQATPALTATEGCEAGSQYVADATIPDGTRLRPGERFVKSWRVKNTGTCDWHAGYELVFSSGEPMGGPESIPLPAVAAGEEGEVPVTLVAPGEPGLYKGVWRMQRRGGEHFGTNLTVVVEVVGEGTVVETLEAEARTVREVAPQATWGAE
jgi:hypothetical protein